jgi:hypothetical protein
MVDKYSVVIPRGDGVLESTMYYDMDGKPYTGKTFQEILFKWSADFEKTPRHVAETKMWFGLVRVSTVWLGLNHSWGGDKPLIFETMVFWRSGYRELYCRRYSSKVEAIDGHMDTMENIEKIIMEEVWSWITRKLVQPWTEFTKFLKSRLKRNTK